MARCELFRAAIRGTRCRETPSPTPRSRSSSAPARRSCSTGGSGTHGATTARRRRAASSSTPTPTAGSGRATSPGSTSARSRHSTRSGGSSSAGARARSATGSRPRRTYRFAHSARRDRTRAVRVLVVSDMEGVAGIVRWEQVTGGDPMYEEARRLYTEEINAAVRGARTAGATEIVVMDCHGAGKGWDFNSLVPELLHPACEYVVQQEWTEYTTFLED